MCVLLCGRMDTKRSRCCRKFHVSSGQEGGVFAAVWQILHPSVTDCVVWTKLTGDREYFHSGSYCFVIDSWIRIQLDWVQIRKHRSKICSLSRSDHHRITVGGLCAIRTGSQGVCLLPCHSPSKSVGCPIRQPSPPCSSTLKLLQICCKILCACKASSLQVGTFPCPILWRATGAALRGIVPLQSKRQAPRLPAEGRLVWIFRSVEGAVKTAQ